MIPPEHSSGHTDTTSIATDTSREIWSAALEKITRHGGPYVADESTDQFYSAADVAVRLCPSGLPDRRKRRVVPEGVDVSEYAHFLKKIFTRVAPAPISELRYRIQERWVGAFTHKL